MNIVLRALLVVFILLTQSCSQPKPVLRIGTNVWSGYEPFYLAREDGRLDGANIRLVEMASSSDVMSALRLGILEGGALTLDEVLVLASEGLDLTILLVCDQSMGADVVMARPDIRNAKGLKGRNIAAETSAVGALMLHTLLEQAGIQPKEITIHHLDLADHLTAYRAGQIDAAVSFPPYSAALRNEGARTIFSSEQIPGQIVDVLAVVSSSIPTYEGELRTLIQGYLASRNDIVGGDQDALDVVNLRMRLSPTDLLHAYDGLELPDLRSNRKLLSGSPSPVTAQAEMLEALMLENQLLERPLSQPIKTSAEFLPRVQ